MKTTPQIGSTWNTSMMSSIRQDWATPKRLFEMIDREFHFTLDACADSTNAKVSNFISEHSLDREWAGIVWCNPPYGRGIGRWIEKAFRESRRGATVVMLIPARTDTSWFHTYCMKGEVRFLAGRLKFDDQKKDAPFPSAIVIFRPEVSA